MFKDDSIYPYKNLPATVTSSFRTLLRNNNIDLNIEIAQDNVTTLWQHWRFTEGTRNEKIR
jgi:hypothetical protein